jgi:hypothetical protein
MARLPVTAPTVSVPLFVPDAGDTVSHVWFPDAVQFSVPPPLLLTATVCVGGLAPPAVAANVSGVVTTLSVGAAVTLNVTPTVCVVPPPVTVTVPV